jgi:hypothetical protein
MLVAMPRSPVMTIMVAMIPVSIIPPSPIEMPVAVVIAIWFVVSIQITATEVVFVITMEVTSITMTKVLTVAVTTVMALIVTPIVASCDKLDCVFHSIRMMAKLRFNRHFGF